MTSRRQFIGLAGASLAGLAASSSAAARAVSFGGRQTGAIAESFVFDEWLTAMDGAVAKRGNRGDRAFWQAFRRDDESAIGQEALLTLPAPGVELFEPEQARDMAALANDRLAARVRDGGALAGLATLSALDPHAAREAERAIALGLAGIALGANRTKRLDDRSLWPIYDYAQSAGVAIYLPASYAPAAGDIPYRALGAPGILAGAAAESAGHARQLIFGGVLDAFPRLTVVLARLGEGAPYWHAEMAATRAALHAADARAPRHAAEYYFEANIALTTADMRSAETFAYCGDVIGARRVLRSLHGDGALARGIGATAFDAGALFRARTV